MARWQVSIALCLLCAAATFAADPIKPDSAITDVADTLFVIPFGPTAGSITEAARITVLDTIAGWARIQVDGWIPVNAVGNRWQSASTSESSGSSWGSKSPAVKRPQCAAITTSGKRCSRKAQAASVYCWQHQNKATK